MGFQLMMTLMYGLSHQISPSWNSLVHEYYSDRRNNPPLEAVHLTRGGPEQESDVTVKVRLSPHHHYRAFFKGWTGHSNVSFTLSNVVAKIREYRLQIELESSSLRLRVIEMDRPTLIAALLFYLVEAGVVAWRLHFSISIAMIVVAIGLFVRLFKKSGPGVGETRKKLAHIFSHCSFIETLYVHKVNRETLDVIRKALKDVPIKNMVIYDNYCDQHLRFVLFFI